MTKYRIKPEANRGKVRYWIQEVSRDNVIMYRCFLPAAFSAVLAMLAVLVTTIIKGDPFADVSLFIVLPTGFVGYLVAVAVFYGEVWRTITYRDTYEEAFDHLAEIKAARTNAKLMPTREFK